MPRMPTVLSHMIKHFVRFKKPNQDETKMREYIILKDLILNNETFNSEVKHKVVHFKKNETILSFNKVYPNFYFIKKGAVKVVVLEGHTSTNKNKGSIASNLSKNHTFGEFGLFDNSPAVTDIVAILDTEVIEIDKKSFTNFLSKNKEIGYDVMIELFEAMCSQIRRQNKNFYHLMNRNQR